MVPPLPILPKPPDNLKENEKLPIVENQEIKANK